jgi:hypothetical protein
VKNEVMANIDNASNVERRRNGAKGRVTRLREGNSPGAPESEVENMGKQAANRRPHKGLLNPLIAFAEINDIVVWFLAQVVLPLSCLIGVSVFVFYFIMKIPGTFEYLIGNGVLLIFGGLLLLGTFRTIFQARSFAQKYGKDIRLERFAYLLLVESIFLLFLYAINSFGMNCRNLVPKIDPAIFGGLKEWTYVGIGGVAVAIVFSLVAILRMSKALLSLALSRYIRGGKV